MSELPPLFGEDHVCVTCRLAYRELSADRCLTLVGESVGALAELVGAMDDEALYVAAGRVHRCGRRSVVALTAGKVPFRRTTREVSPNCRVGERILRMTSVQRSGGCPVGRPAYGKKGSTRKSTRYHQTALVADGLVSREVGGAGRRPTGQMANPSRRFNRSAQRTCRHRQFLVAVLVGHHGK